MMPSRVNSLFCALLGLLSLVLWSPTAVWAQEEAKDSEDPVALGARLFGEGDLEGALVAFEEALAEDADDTGVLFNAAVVAHRLKQHDRALVHIENALAEEPKEVRFHVLQSAILTQLERSWEALAALERAVELDDEDAQILFRLGNLYFQLDRKDDAIEAFQKAVKEDRKLLRAYYNLGTALAEVGRDQEAVEAYRVALEPIDEQFSRGEEVDPIHARAYLNLGGIFFRGEDWIASLDAYAKALQLDPQQSAALYNQGFILHRLKRYAEAEAAYRKALELDSELPLAYLHLGEARWLAGAPGEAVPWLEKGLQYLDASQRVEALILLARSRLAIGEDTVAEQRYREVLEAGDALSEEQSFEALDAVARLARARGADGEAEELLLRARMLRPDDDGVILETAGLALTRLRQGRTEDALKLLEMVDLDRVSAQITPEKAALLRAVLGLLDLSGGQEESGLEKIRAAAAATDTPAQVLAAKALLDARADRLAEAAATLEEVLPLLGADRVAKAEDDLERIRRLLRLRAVDAEDPRKALAAYDSVAATCAAASESVAGREGSLQFTFGEGGDSLCDRLPALSASARVRVALLDLAQNQAQAAFDGAAGALAGELTPSESATAYFVRGMSGVSLGRAAATGDLTTALGGDLPQDLRDAAQNQLGVAFLRSDRIEEARRAFEQSAMPEAKLNLAILLDDHGGPEQALKALELYEEYIAAGGARRADAETWAERLRGIYR